MSSTALSLRDQAERISGSLPPLLADALRLAQSMRLGGHGRRRSGAGSEFWQFRTAVSGDSPRQIDWRRSARGETTYVREREWQAAQSVAFFVDPGLSMDFTSDAARFPTKRSRAALLALALAVLLDQAGERIGTTDGPISTGSLQLQRLAESFARETTTNAEVPDYGEVSLRAVPTRARAVLLSDFLTPLEPVIAEVTQAANRGITGTLVQVLDPSETSFPFGGRTCFESMGASLVFEVQRAAALRKDYLALLAKRQDDLTALARSCGWQFLRHVTAAPAQPALVWLYGALGQGLTR